MAITIPGSEGKFGLVVARVLKNVGDGNDEDAYPEYIPDSGTAIFSPQQASVITSDPVAYMSRERVVCKFSPETGELLNVGEPQTPGVWLAVGEWKVSISVGSGINPNPITITVTEDHTSEHPLNLFALLPPSGGPNVTIYQLQVPSGMSNGDILVWNDSGFTWVPYTPGGGSEVEGLTEIFGSSSITVTNGTTTPTISIKDGGVLESHISNNAITVNKLFDGAVTEGKIGTGAVTEGKIGASAVTSNKIASNSVIEAKISDSAVTNAKLASNAVTDPKIANNAVTTNKIIDGAVTEGKIGTGAVSSNKLSSAVQASITNAANSANWSSISEKPDFDSALTSFSFGVSNTYVYYGSTRINTSSITFYGSNPYKKIAVGAAYTVWDTYPSSGNVFLKNVIITDVSSGVITVDKILPEGSVELIFTIGWSSPPIISYGIIDTLSLSSSVANVTGSVKLYKYSDGQVICDSSGGWVNGTGASINANTVIATLPNGWRPKATSRIAAFMSTDAKSASIATNGEIAVGGGAITTSSKLTLDGSWYVQI